MERNLWTRTRCPFDDSEFFYECDRACIFRGDSDPGETQFLPKKTEVMLWDKKVLLPLRVCGGVDFVLALSPEGKEH